MEALNRREIPPYLQRELANALLNTNPNVTIAQEWATLRGTVSRHRRGLQQGILHVPCWLKEEMAEYMAVLGRVIEHIDRASMRQKDAESGQPAAIKDAQARAREDNQQRARDGKRPLGACDKRWQSWAPPHIVDACVQSFEDAYARALRGRGKRIMPFHPQDERMADIERIARLRAQLVRVRADNNAGRGYSAKPHEALSLMCAAQAGRALAASIVDPRTRLSIPYRWDAPHPIVWTDLLEPDKRQRLFAARKGESVDTHDLNRFYRPEE